MSRFVDVDWVISFTGEGGDLNKESILTFIKKHTNESIPISDVMPITRCEKCKYHIEDAGEYWCHGWGWPDRMVPKHGFCHKGDKE